MLESTAHILLALGAYYGATYQSLLDFPPMLSCASHHNKCDNTRQDHRDRKNTFDANIYFAIFSSLRAWLTY